MKNEKIDEIYSDVKNFLGRASKSDTKITDIENKISKMQNDFLGVNSANGVGSIKGNNMQTNSGNDMGNDMRNDMKNIVTNVNLEEKTAFDNFIRNGTNSELVTNSLSGNADNGDVLLNSTLQNKILNGINENSPMRNLASIEKISTRSYDIVIEDGAFTSGWVTETASRDVTDTSKLRKQTIHTHEIYAQPKATQNIIDDSEINVESWLIGRLVNSFVKLENEAFISGDGNNKPFGLLRNNDVSKIDVGEEISPDILLKLINELEEGYLANASFLMNRKTLSVIQGLKDTTGRFIWQQSLSDPLKQTIFGVPVVISSHMPDLGKDKLPIVIGDFKSAYKIIDRSGMNIVRDQYTDKPYVKFYAVKRVGGDVVNPEALKFAKFSA